MQSAENGGIQDDLPYLDSIAFSERSTIPTQLGINSPEAETFSSDIGTGTKYTNASYLLRQQYDIGQKDSIVTDTTVIPLFYPRLRLEHTLNLKTYKYRFFDANPDSAYYKSRYNIDTPTTFLFRIIGKELMNDFSIYTFPDAQKSTAVF